MVGDRYGCAGHPELKKSWLKTKIQEISAKRKGVDGRTRQYLFESLRVQVTAAMAYVSRI